MEYIIFIPDVILQRGGELGIELLIYNLLNISPAIVSIIIDITSYVIGGLLFGEKFLLNEKIEIGKAREIKEVRVGLN